MPTCDETGLEIDDVVSTVSEDLFMSTVCFEDFLTREFDNGENAIDDYLWRRIDGGRIICGGTMQRPTPRRRRQNQPDTNDDSARTHVDRRLWEGSRAPWRTA